MAEFGDTGMQKFFGKRYYGRTGFINRESYQNRPKRKMPLR